MNTPYWAYFNADGSINDLTWSFGGWRKTKPNHTPFKGGGDWQKCQIFPIDVPTRGSLAICSQGRLGIVTEHHKREVKYPDGLRGLAYVGVHVHDGSPWSSRKPKVIGFVNDIDAFLKAKNT